LKARYEESNKAELMAVEEEEEEEEEEEDEGTSDKENQSIVPIPTSSKGNPPSSSLLESVLDAHAATTPSISLSLSMAMTDDSSHTAVKAREPTLLLLLHRFTR